MSDDKNGWWDTEPDCKNSGAASCYLLPCPFCGEQEDLTVYFVVYDGTCEPIRGHTYAYVECLPCDCRTGNCFENDAEINGFGNCKEMAITAWNRRAKRKLIKPPTPPRYDDVFEKGVEWLDTL